MEILTLEDMKTNVIMKRPMGYFEVQQRISDGFFDANALLFQWNSVKGNPQRAMSRFFESEGTKAFIEALKEDLSQHANVQLGEFQVFKEVKGKNTAHGKTKGQMWVHPYLFIKFAMWLNPRFEVQVIKFVYDELIKNRHLAGDNYNVLTAALATMPDIDYKKVATAIQWIVFNRTGKNLRQQATQEQLSEISDIESKLAYAINMGFIKSYDELILTMRKMYNDKYQKF